VGRSEETVPLIGMVVSMQCWKKTPGQDRHILGGLSRLTPPPQIHPPRSELHFGDHHSTPAKPSPRYNPTMDSRASGLSSPSGTTPKTRTEQWERDRRARSSPACAAWERPSSPAGLSSSPRESLFGVGLFPNY
jgi:hypothetical protein